MTKYRKKPVVIDAIQWVCKTYWGLIEISKELGFDIIANPSGFYIETLEGRMKVSPDDYVIKGVKGEVYPCKPDIFAMTYEAVE